MNKRFVLPFGLVVVAVVGWLSWDAFRKEAQCASYEKEMAALVRDAVENMVLRKRLLQKTGDNPLLMMGVLSELTAAEAKQGRLQGEADSIRAEHKQECGLERNEKWWNENMEKAKKEADPNGEVF